RFFSSCLLTRRCLPESLLFPYTTLFRSRGEDAVGADAAAQVQHAVARLDLHHLAQRPRPQVELAVRERAGPRHEPARRAIADLEDRKSTRLNSSHRTISYAVFCLKKKTH